MLKPAAIGIAVLLTAAASGSASAADLVMYDALDFAGVVAKAIPDHLRYERPTFETLCLAFRQPPRCSASTRPESVLVVSRVTECAR